MPERPKSPFLESVRELIRVKHLSYRTEEAYLAWIRRFILF
ncbi:phage integrase N-terminal SAM-like domain-containing protein, partial [Escherichia coli]|nr:phage integrase N-terminal SAM-like domain-containing protein [Escherichia coli]